MVNDLPTITAISTFIESRNNDIPKSELMSLVLKLYNTDEEILRNRVNNILKLLVESKEITIKDNYIIKKR